MLSDRYFNPEDLSACLYLNLICGNLYHSATTYVFHLWLIFPCYLCFVYVGKINLFKSPNRPLEKSFLSLSWKLSNKENNGGNYSFCFWQEYLHYNLTFFIRERKKWKWEEIRHCSSFFQLRHLVLFLNLNFSIRFGITIILDSVSRSWLNNLKLNTVNPQLKTFPCPERCLHK